MHAVNFCAYRHIFGVEGEGVHKYRVFNIAIVDTVLTILGSWLLSRYLGLSFLAVFLFVMVLGVLVHRLFCVQTTLTKWVFDENKF